MYYLFSWVSLYIYLWQKIPDGRDMRIKHMKIFLNTMLTIVLVCIFIRPSYSQQNLSKAMVKIYAAYSEYDYDMPWQISKQGENKGSGCIISKNRVLTNAHVVANSTFIQVKRAGEAKKYIAEVECVAHDCDLAVLKVSDDSFFAGVEPIEIGDLPRMGDKVAVYGFPEGGDELCITEGIVSRVEYQYYTQSMTYLLSCQIDAAINSGNSGGPVLKDGKIVGIAFETLESGKNIGYMIPVPIINHFLKDIEDGKYHGFPSLEVFSQTMENLSLRLKYHMSNEQTGVLITYVSPGSAVQEILRPGDVALSIDGKTIENDATIRFRDNERISANYVIHSKFIGDLIKCRILRDGKIKDVEITLKDRIDSTRLVPHMHYDKAPTYYILGGLVFQPLTLNYIKTWEKLADAPNRLVDYYFNGRRSRDRNEVIVLTNILGDKINVGYDNFKNNVVSQINGKKISSMEDLVKAIEFNERKYHVIVDEQGNQIVLERSKVSEANQRIFNKYQIRSDRSEDLREIQNRIVIKYHENP
jgi:S1-C subfamily serine protease